MIWLRSILIQLFIVIIVYFSAPSFMFSDNFNKLDRNINNTQKPTKKYIFSGIVIKDIPYGDGVSGATVELGKYLVKTDKNGRFSFDTIKYGKYKVKISKNGYDPDCPQKSIKVNSNSSNNKFYLVTKPKIPKVSGINPKIINANTSKQSVSIFGIDFNSSSSVIFKCKGIKYNIFYNKIDYINQNRIDVKDILLDKTGEWALAVINPDGTISSEYKFFLEKKIKSISALPAVSVFMGQAPFLSSDVTVNYNDGSIGKMPVIWPTVDTSSEGTVSIKGAIEDYPNGVLLNINVKDPYKGKLTSIDYAKNVAKEVVVRFEGGLYAVSGNWDDAGLSVGYLQFNLGQGSLQPLLNIMANTANTKNEFESIFNFNTGDNKKIKKAYQAVREMLCSSQYEQIKWGNSISSINTNKYRLINPWDNAFDKLTHSNSFLYIEDTIGSRDYYNTAYKIMNTIGLRTVRSYVLAFDIAVNNGSISSWNLINEAMSGKGALLNPNDKVYDTKGISKGSASYIKKVTDKRVVQDLIKHIANVKNPLLRKCYFAAATAALQKGVSRGICYSWNSWSRKLAIIEGKISNPHLTDAPIQ